MGNKLTHEYVAGQFLASGCELLETYTKSSRPMSYRCSCGNLSRGSWNNFARGKRCQECLRKKRSGVNNYQWREDRSRKYMEYRFRQTAWRVQKQTGATPDCSLKNCEKNFGYSFDQFHDHVVKQPDWRADGRWEIDHVFPVWAFTEAGVFDLKVIHALDNLRVLPKMKNRQKCYKFNPFDFVKWLAGKGVHGT